MQGPCPAEGSPHRRPTWACSVGLTLWGPGRIGGHGSLVPSQKAEASVVPALQEEGAVQMGPCHISGPRSRLRRPALGAVQAPEAKSVLAMGSNEGPAHGFGS